MTATEAFTGIRYGRCVATLAAVASGASAVGISRAVGAPSALTLLTSVIALGVCAALAAHLGRVQIFVNDQSLSYRVGLGRRHRVSWSEVTGLERTSVRTAAVFGLDIPQTSKTLRYVVAPGPALRVQTKDGLDLWLSIPDSLTTPQLTVFRTPPSCD
ncbi:hypothetical protein [Dermacoccus sp. GAS27A]|uniref:hypothetical protein n=1 Tax=Dermacoccus sp. GAS27A TaxID=3156270 RepID=UPI003834C983